MTLKEKAFSAVRWTAAAMLFQVGLSFIQVAIVARLLNPSDYGIMALCGAVMAFVQIFAEMGISNAIVHHRDISREQLSSLYWFNILSGSALAMLIVVASPFISTMYDEPQLLPILILMSTTLVIAAFGQQFGVLAERNLEFGLLTVINVVRGVVSFSVIVGSALAGAGVYALVWGAIASSTVGSLLNWWLLSKSYRPGFRLRIAEIMPFLNYGIYMVGNNLVNSFSMQADVLMGGRWLSVSTLGVFSLPRDLSLKIQFLINSVVTRVGFPIMAQAQNDSALLKSIYLKTLRMTASINFPVYFGVAAFAPEIVNVMFGGKWTESISILRILALWGVVRSTLNPIGSLLFAVGRVRLALFWNVSCVPVLLMTYWAGLQYGALGLAWSMLAYVFVVSPISWYVLARPACKATFSQYYLQILLPALCSACAIFMGYAVALIVTEKIVWSGTFSLMGELRANESILRLAIGAIAAAPVYVLFSRIFNRTWFDAMVELLRGKR